MKINIKDYADNHTAVSYDQGKKCFLEMKKALEKDENITLDFIDVTFVITAFLNPIIGDFILEYGESVMSKVKIENASQSILEKIKMVKDGALIKREDIDE